MMCTILNTENIITDYKILGMDKRNYNIFYFPQRTLPQQCSGFSTYLFGIKMKAIV